MGFISTVGYVNHQFIWKDNVYIAVRHNNLIYNATRQTQSLSRLVSKKFPFVSIAVNHIEKILKENKQAAGPFIS
jgi:hypothetical protein